MSDVPEMGSPLVLREVRLVDKILRGLYRNPRLGNMDDPFSELVYIILSQRTRETAYREVYSALRKRFPVGRPV
jgi:endonuclease III